MNEWSLTESLTTTSENTELLLWSRKNVIGLRWKTDGTIPLNINMLTKNNCFVLCLKMVNAIEK